MPNISSHPVLLTVRFLLELGALASFARFGLSLSTTSLRFVWMVALPVLAAAAWGTFAVPNDPSRSGNAPVPVPGALRLALELAFFGAGTWALFRTNARTLGIALGVMTLVLYLLSFDRVVWLLRR